VHGTIGAVFAKSQFTLGRSVFQQNRGTTPVIVLQIGRKGRPRMTDFTAKDDEDRWGADRAECFAATEQRGWDPQGGATRPDPVAACHQPTTATGRWRRFILIVAAVSALSWAVVIGIMIAALAKL